MPDAAEKGLDDTFLEIASRIEGDDLFAKRARKLFQPLSQHIKTNPGVSATSGRMYCVMPGVVWSAMASHAG